MRTWSVPLWNGMRCVFVAAVLAAGLLKSVRGDILPADRRIKWEPGIPGGVPVRTTIFCDVTKAIPGSELLAVGDGLADDTAPIQTALDRCPPNEVVYLPAGIYRTTNSLMIKTSVVLRGAGPDKTTILTDFSAEGGVGVVIQAPNLSGSFAVGLVSGYHKGSTNVVIAAPQQGLYVGCHVLIDQLNDGTNVTHIGNSGPAGWVSRDNGVRALMQLVEVTGISGGTNITFAPPLYSTYSSALLPQMYCDRSRLPGANFVCYAGLEDLKMDQRRKLRSCIRLWWAACCWVKNVETRLGGRNHFDLLYAFRSEIRDCYYHDVWDLVPGSNYGIELGRGTTACLIQNNISIAVRAPIIVGGGIAGNVISYNYATNHVNHATNQCEPTISFHAAHSSMNLVEGNVGVMFNSDFYWGSSSHNTLFRNWLAGRQPNNNANLYSVALDWRSYCYNLVGNVLGYEGITNDVSTCWSLRVSPQPCNYWSTYKAIRLGYQSPGDSGTATPDPKVLSTLLRHGNYDYVACRTEWDPAIGNTNLPPSYYLTSKPAWWNASPWPSIGPDVSGLHRLIPAEERCRAFLQSSPPPKPARLMNLHAGRQ